MEMKSTTPDTPLSPPLRMLRVLEAAAIPLSLQRLPRELYPHTILLQTHPGKTMNSHLRMTKMTITKAGFLTGLSRFLRLWF